MDLEISPEQWAGLVKAEYDEQCARGVNPALLSETLLWNTPGGDCLDRLALRGLRAVPTAYAVELRPVEIS